MWGTVSSSRTKPYWVRPLPPVLPPSTHGKKYKVCIWMRFLFIVIVNNQMEPMALRAVLSEETGVWMESKSQSSNSGFIRDILFLCKKVIVHRVPYILYIIIVILYTLFLWSSFIVGETTHAQHNLFIILTSKEPILIMLPLYYEIIFTNL